MTYLESYSIGLLWDAQGGSYGAKKRPKGTSRSGSLTTIPVCCARRTHQIVASIVGDHSEATCQRPWDTIPTGYRRCRSYSDFSLAYAAVFPAETHTQLGKDSGHRAHQERWYNTMHQ